MYTILIVEDDLVIAESLKRHLENWGFAAFACEDFADVLGEFARRAPDLVLMDLSLPFYNGFYWCGEIRKRSTAPVVFLSSHSDNMDVVMAMSMGGDDYLTKPFAPEVLVAKLNAVLRRAYGYVKEPPKLCMRGFTLEPAEAALHGSGVTVELTRNETRILKTLFEHPNAVVSREELMLKLWDSDSFIDDNTLTVNVNRLRKKLEEAGLKELIVTKKGLGYMAHDPLVSARA